jgi:acyl carrier protein
MTERDIQARLHRIAAAVAGPSRVPADAGPDTPLGETGYWLDSVDIVEVVLASEREFAVTFDGDDDLTSQALSSIRTLAALIAGKLPR